MRNTILSVYQPSHLAKLIPTMQSYIESATADLDSQGDMQFSDLSLKLATDVIGQAAFGEDFSLSKLQSGNDSHQQNDEEVQEFINRHIYSTTQLKMDLSGSLSIILGMLVSILQEPFRQVLKRIPGTMDRKVSLTNHNLTSRLDQIVTKKMEEKDHSSKYFLSLVLNARESSSAARNAFTPDYISAVSTCLLAQPLHHLHYQLSSTLFPGIQKLRRNWFRKSMSLVPLIRYLLLMIFMENSPILIRHVITYSSYFINFEEDHESC